MNDRHTHPGAAGRSSPPSDSSAVGSESAYLHESLSASLPPTPVSPVNATLAPQTEVVTRHGPLETQPRHPGDFIRRLLENDEVELPPFDCQPLTHPPRSPADHHALAAALGCPDLFLIAGRSPALLVDLAIESAQPGKRIALLTSSTRSANDLVQAIAAHGSVEAIRCLTDTETVDQLPPEIRAQTIAGRNAARQEAESKRIREELAEITERRRATAEALSLAERLLAEPVSDDLTPFTVGTVDELLVQLQQEELSDPGSEFAERVRRLREQHSDTIRSLDRDIEVVGIDLENRSKALAAVRSDQSLTAAGNHGLIGFIKGIFGKPSSVAVAEPECRVQELELSVKSLTDDHARLMAERSQLIEQHSGEIEAIFREAATQRQSQAIRRRDELESRRLTEQRLCDLSAVLGSPCPKTLHGSELAGLASRFSSSIPALDTELAVLHQRLDTVLETDADSGAEMESVIFIGPYAAHGEMSASLRSPPRLFDHLILADAHEPTENELFAAVNLARRWVLVGDPAPAARRSGPAARPGTFSRLWQHLTRRTWAREGHRWLFRLIEVSYRDSLRTEPLTDRPSIELRFAESADGEVTLAGVVFPPRCSAAEAKTFLAQELDDVRLQGFGPLEWAETPAQIIAHWPAAAAQAGPSGLAELAHGIRESVLEAGSDVITQKVTFDRSAGWTRERAEAWIAEHSAAARSLRTAIASLPSR